MTDLLPDPDRPDGVRTFRPAGPVDVRLTLAPLCRGPGDPCMRIRPDGVWRATRTPEGPVTTRTTGGGADGTLTMWAWGPGTDWALDGFPALVGAAGADGFLPRPGVVADLHRRTPGLRIPRAAAVIEALVPSILEQKVPGAEARRSYARLVRALGEPAPGPSIAFGPRRPSIAAGPRRPGSGLLVPPAAATLAATPSYVFHRFGVERRRADTIRLACSYAARMEETLAMPPAAATLATTPSSVFHRFGVERRRADTIRLACSYASRLEDALAMPPASANQRLAALPGIGPWTAAEVGRVALGDTDAVSVGDYHLPDQIAWALAGEPRADDARMLELLEPYRGHRARVIRLVETGVGAAPRFGPRTPLRSIAPI